MTAQTRIAHEGATTNLHLTQGSTYTATTRGGSATGEYLGMEAPHGDLTIMLRDAAGTHSIELSDVTSIQALAA